MDNQTLQDAFDKIKKLQEDLDALNSEFYRNNFSYHQDFNKMCSFNTRLKVPHYEVLPLTCEQGELVESGGILYIASAPNTWTKAGTQT